MFHHLSNAMSFISAPPKGLPKITENPTTTIGQVGDSTHLQCEVSATPSASVVWIKDNFFPIDHSDSRYRLIGKINQIHCLNS